MNHQKHIAAWKKRDEYFELAAISPKWWNRYNGSVRSLVHQSADRCKLQNQNHKLQQRQLTQWDVTRSYRRVNVNLNIDSVAQKFHKDKTESELKYMSEETNRHINFLSYFKMSSMDCYTLCHNTRQQISSMAAFCELSDELIFFWFHRFYTSVSFARQSIMFGVSASALKKWWPLTTSKLRKWGEQYLINDGPDEEQYWTTERIHAHTTEMAKKLHDPCEEGRTIVVMDGTYIEVRCIMTDHQLKQRTWSQHKHYHLLKPHLTVCTDGKVIDGGEVYYGNIAGSDTTIFRSMTDIKYVKWCLENQGHAECHLDLKACRRRLWLHKIWGLKKPITITDNGYKWPHKAIRHPKDLSKKERGTTLASHWKRGVTMVRQVTERVNRSIKKWKKVGEGAVPAQEIHLVGDYITIALAHHNVFSCTYQKDHVDNAVQVRRLLELRTVVKNPCDALWIPRPP